MNCCKKCGKELPNPKMKYCPICKTKKDEKRNKIVKNALSVVIGVACIVGTKGKFGGKKG